MKCEVCRQPAIPGLSLCGPCATGEASTAGQTLVAAKPATVPADPKPGERFMRKMRTNRGRSWQVEVKCADGSSNLVASLLSEADARLLVFGAKAVAALNRLESAAESYAADQSRASDPRCGRTQPITVAEGNELNAAISVARVTLADLEGVSR